MQDIDYCKDFEGLEFDIAKQCALVAVEELIKYDEDYWLDVQTEINNTFAV